MTSWQPSRPPRSAQDPRPVGESLDRVARRLGAPRAPVLTAVFSGWAGLVGPDVAAHASPVSLRAGILTVEVDQPAWVTQLRFLSGDLLRRVREVTGEDAVAEVRVRVRAQGGGPGGRPSGPPAR